MIEKININGVEYHVTPVAEGELPTGVTVKVDGVVYQLGDPVVATAAEPAATSTEGTIEKISVNGVVYDIADVEAVAEERKRAMEAEATIGNNFSEELGREIDARMSVDNDTRSKGVLFGGFSNRQTTADEVFINYKNIDQKAEGAFAIPAATTEKAGVMSAEDKKSLDTATSRALRALFVAAGAEYNDSGVDKTKTAPWGENVIHKAGHYYLNGLGDITEEQMIRIYDAGRIVSTTPAAQYRNSSIRTNIVSVLSGTEGQPLNLYYTCSGNYMEVFNNTKNTETSVVSMHATFAYSSRLKYIIPTIVVSDTKTSNDVTNTFTGCKALVLCKLKRLRYSFSFKDCPLISKESVQYIIDYSAPTSAITITLHPDAYARLADDADIVAALEAQPLVTLISA